MPKPCLREPYATLASDMTETFLAGCKRWRPDLGYPESHSDMRAGMDALLQMFEVKRRPIALAEKDIWAPTKCPKCGGSGSQDCDDPQCNDSTWDHHCNAGTCDDCKGSGKLEKA
jgi:hypothetical protein